MPYAGFWRRFLALIIDALILGIAFWTLVFGLGASALDLGAVKTFITSIVELIVSGGKGLSPAGPDFAIVQRLGRLLIMVWLGQAVVTWLYCALLESSPLRATLGKAALGIVVTDGAGERIGFLRATVRHLGKILSAAILMIGFLMAGVTARKQALHDLIAETLVVKRFQTAGAWDLTARPSPYPLSPSATPPIPPPPPPPR